MVQIFFFSPSGYAPMKDEVLRQMLQQSHGWQADGADWVYGVAIPDPKVHPQDVVDKLTELGVIVIPSVHDKDTDPHPDVMSALAQHGINKGDKARDVATKMHQACGMPVLRPHLY